MRSFLAVLVLFLPLAVWVGHRTRPEPAFRLPSPGDDAFANLGIEPVEHQLAPNFSLKNIHGKPVQLHDFRKKVILLNFWATWCPSCRFEMPAMEALYQELSAQGLAVVAVALRDGAADVQSFYREHGLSFPALLDHDAETSQLYKIWSLPASFVIDREGYIVGKLIGYRDWNSHESKEFFLRLLRSPT